MGLKRRNMRSEMKTEMVMRRSFVRRRLLIMPILFQQITLVLRDGREKGEVVGSFQVSNVHIKALGVTDSMDRTSTRTVNH